MSISFADALEPLLQIDRTRHSTGGRILETNKLEGDVEEWECGPPPGTEVSIGEFNLRTGFTKKGPLGRRDFFVSIEDRMFREGQPKRNLQEVFYVEADARAFARDIKARLPEIARVKFIDHHRGTTIATISP